MGLLRSRAALSAFVPALAGTGWLPGDSQTLGPGGKGVKERKSRKTIFPPQLTKMNKQRPCPYT
jgi:hypothetical protein